MLKYKNEENKKFIVLLSVLIIFGLTLTGCNWFENGIINVFDPRAQIRVTYNPMDTDCPEPEEGEIATSFNLSVASLNEVEFFIEGFKYTYEGEHFNSGHITLPEFDRIIEVSFYVEPSFIPGTLGNSTTICNIPFYFQEVLDYTYLNPLITEVTMDCILFGTDGAGHKLTFPVATDLPVTEPGVDFVDPKAEFDVYPDTTGFAPFKVTLDASGSTDDRGIASYSWDFGDNQSGSGVLVTHTYSTPGVYTVTLTVTDYWGNKDFATETIIVEEAEEMECADIGG